ncbi:MAG: hypothetical protein KIT72_09410 [Polyangiaceae bacterium]|nr:hypothetical protein [Polyangiaceae bacterium]MCW5790624.1 hypothetical protein [Polyangiaceae bacterium]
MQHAATSTRRLTVALASILSAGLTLGCTITTRSPCVSSGGCGAGQECLASTCVPEGGEPVAAESQRLVLTPGRWLVTSHRGLAGQPQAVHLGGAADEELLLDFAVAGAVPGGARRLERAFLILTLLPGGAASPELVEVSVARLVEPWPRGAAGRSAPRRGHPISAGLSRTSLPLRVDVTALVQRWLDNPHSSHGVVVASSSSQGLPHAYATGLGGGAAPQLELYFHTEISAAHERRRARPERGPRARSRERSEGRERPRDRRRGRPERGAPDGKPRSGEPAQPRSSAQPRSGAQPKSATPRDKAPRDKAAPNPRPRTSR